MNKNDVRWNDESITPSCGNIFIDLGFEPAEAEVMKLRAEVMIRMRERLKETGWTQAEAARRLGVTQPRVSRLIKGKIEDFSLDMLLTLSARVGLHPELRFSTRTCP
ncbi:MAG: helix-turn-helix domain-containing protein [Zoogloeaceae bacterium]|jgi:predicted XRE-type DNA-binding protein|nr:helix-turn-helix domain-containing protein [Zoogloeaceae bacterium]